MNGLNWIALLGVGLPLGVLAAGQLGWLGGRVPADLGVRDGRLKAPSSTPNSVSSQAALWPGHPQQAYAQIAPLAAPLARVQQVAVQLPGARIVAQRADYLHIEYTTRWLGFVDDAEFWADPAAPGVTQLRSASRVGRKDFGVNRARIEQIRKRLSPSAG